MDNGCSELTPYLNLQPLLVLPEEHICKSALLGLWGRYLQHRVVEACELAVAHGVATAHEGALATGTKVCSLQERTVAARVWRVLSFLRCFAGLLAREPCCAHRAEEGPSPTQSEDCLRACNACCSTLSIMCNVR